MTRLEIVIVRVWQTEKQKFLQIDTFQKMHFKSLFSMAIYDNASTLGPSIMQFLGLEKICIEWILH